MLEKNIQKAEQLEKKKKKNVYRKAVYRIQQQEEQKARQKLTKYSSVAQKYSQMKAEKQGRSNDDKPKHWKDLVPRDYWDFSDRFEEKAAQRLPHSTKWDMKIEFVPRQEPLKKKAIYPLTPVEKDAVKEFIQDNLGKGWIRRSESEYAMPVFFVGKKDAGARMVIDYRLINAVCKVDQYPIPIMYTLPDELGNVKWFTTLDLQTGYNNLQI